MIAEIVAVGSIAVVLYHFVVYPLVVMALAGVRRKPRATIGGISTPKSVTLVVAAYNEEKVIAGKIANALSLEYPADKLQIVIVADGSTDRTVEIARSFADPRVRCLFEPERRGKAHALNRAVAATACDVIVLSDANNLYSPRAIELLVAKLDAPGVGGVTGVKRVVQDARRAASVGDGLYWKYESRIKEAESRLGGTVTGDGEIFALWRALYVPIPPEVVNDDVYLTLRLVEKGYSVHYEPQAVAVEEGSMTIREDVNVKIRMIAGGFQNVLQDWRAAWLSGWFTLKFVSHKVLRWMMPLFLIALFVSCAWLAEQPRYRWLLCGQIAFYGSALVGWRLQARGSSALLFYVPFYFVAMNLAAAAAWLRFLKDRQSPLWIKARR